MEEAVSFLFCIGGRIESTYIDDKFWSERARMLLTLAARQSCIIIIHALRGFAHGLKALLNASVRQKLPSVVGRVLESVWKFRT